MGYIIAYLGGANRLACINNIQISKDNYAKIASFRYPKENIIQEGDIILRRMYDMDSNIARNFSNGEKRYSHAGIIVKQNNKFYVIHSIKENHIDGISLTSIKKFLQNTNTWAIYRYKNISYQKINDIALSYLEKNIKFDNNYDLNNNKLYCSEFVYKVFNHKQNIIKATKYFANRLFVTVSDIYQNDKCYLIQSSHRKLNFFVLVTQDREIIT